MANCLAENRRVLKAYNPEKKEYLLYQPRCKMWNCEPCGRVNKLLWQARIGYGYESYVRQGIGEWMFVTITAHEKNKTTAQCLYSWPDAWKKLSARMRRKFPGIRYVLLPEHHKKARVHWHMIASHGLTTRWLKDNAPYCGLGYMDDSSPVKDSWLAIWYVSKYVSKAIGKVEWPKGLRRISTTQKWPILPPEEEFESLCLDWTYLQSYPAEGIWYLAHELERKTGIPTRVLGGNCRPVDTKK